MENDTIIKIIFLSTIIIVIVVVAYFSDKDLSTKYPYYGDFKGGGDFVEDANKNKIREGNMKKKKKVKVRDNQKEPAPLMEVYKNLYEDNKSKTASNIKVKLPTLKK